MVLAATLLAFGMGYASKNAYNTQLLILYSLTALTQIGVNYLIYKKEIVGDWKVFLGIILIVVILYILYPLIIR
jgi:hypothetical protein